MKINKPIKIFIGVGHGGPDSGAVCGNLVESQINLQVASVLAYELERHGFLVCMSRYCDESDKLAEEIAECNQYAPDFAIEIHTNAGGGSGFEVYYPSVGNQERVQQSYAMARLFWQYVRYCQHGKPREIKPNASLAWLMQVNAPTILCENFFVDGPNAAVYARPSELRQLAKAYAVAVLTYYGVDYREDAEIFPVHVVKSIHDVSHKQLQGTLRDGHIYAAIRNVLALVDYGVYYNEKNRELTVYPNVLSDAQAKVLANQA